jgi:hypothetical protein
MYPQLYLDGRWLLLEWRLFRHRRWLHQLFLISILLWVAVHTLGCVGLAAWLADAPTLVSLLANTLPIILGIISQLEGKPVPAAAVTTIQTIANDVKNELANFQTLINAYKSNPNATTLQDIQNLANALKGNFSNIVSNSGITDTGLVAEINEIGQVAISQIDAWLSILPALSGQLKAMAKAEVTVPFSKEEYVGAIKLAIQKNRNDPALDAANAKYLEKYHHVFI